jgi:RNA recognition motif-containing protein
MSTEPTYQRLYVGSLHFSLTDEDVRQIFEPFGALDFVNLHKGMIIMIITSIIIDELTPFIRS